MSRPREVVIVGGGVIGAACAYYSAVAGWKVTVIDRGRFGSACSHGNCGFVCPSHVLPLAAPGAIWPAARSLFKRNSPLKVRIRLDPSLWSWLIKFAGRCNVRDMLSSAQALHGMLQASRQLYNELIGPELTDCEWQERGLLFVYRTQAAWEHFDQTDRFLREQFDLGAKRYTGDELARLEPALKPGLGGAWYYEHDADLRPDKLMTAWRKVLPKYGVTIRESCEFLTLHHTGRAVTDVETSTGVIAADAVVIATGAWTPLFSRQLGCSIPIQPGKGYSITSQRPGLCPRTPIIFEEDRVAITPMQTGYRIGSTMEFAGYDRKLNRARLDLLRRGAARYLHEPLVEPIEEEWFGWRPMIYDGKPAVGRLPKFDNAYVAAGHGMLGVSLAPSTGKLVSELLDGVAPHIDPAPFALERF